MQNTSMLIRVEKNCEKTVGSSRGTMGEPGKPQRPHGLVVPFAKIPPSDTGDLSHRRQKMHS